MPDKKISELQPLPTPINATDVGVIVRGGVNYKFDKDDLPSPSGLEYLDDWDIPTT